MYQKNRTWCWGGNWNTDIIIASFQKYNTVNVLHTATCRMTAAPYAGFIPKIDMFVYTVYIYITLTCYQE